MQLELTKPDTKISGTNVYFLGDVKRLEMAVEEVTASIEDLFFGRSDVPLSCANAKCVKAKWNFHRDTSSHYILFYTIYYLKL